MADPEAIDCGELILLSDAKPEDQGTGAATLANTDRMYLVHHGTGGKAADRMRYLSNGAWSAWIEFPPIGAVCPIQESFQSCIARRAWAPMGDVPCDVVIQTIEVSCVYPNGQRGLATLKQPFTVKCGYEAWLRLD